LLWLVWKLRVERGMAIINTAELKRIEVGLRHPLEVSLKQAGDHLRGIR
jgi:hypothetical protein